MALLLQAALGVPDHEVVELTVMDRRWQMVLGCLGAEEPLFSQGTLFNFRQRMIAKGLDQELFDKTVALARETGGFSATYLRAAFDASPLWGAGRVGKTPSISSGVLRCTSFARPPSDWADRSARSLPKREFPWWLRRASRPGLDIDWDDPDARKTGLSKLLGQVQALGRWLDRELKEQLKTPPLQEQWALVQKLIAQDTEPDPGRWRRGRRITDGVAKDRRISVSDADMRHGRKSKRKRIDGYKRHIIVDVDTPGLICGVAVTPANQPERTASATLLADLNRQRLKLSELFIDRGYLGRRINRRATSRGAPGPLQAIPPPKRRSLRQGRLSSRRRRKDDPLPGRNRRARCAWVRVPISRPRSATPAPNVTRALVPSPAEAAVSAFTRTNPSCSTSGGRPSPRKAAPT